MCLHNYYGKFSYFDLIVYCIRDQVTMDLFPSQSQGLKLTLKKSTKGKKPLSDTEEPKKVGLKINYLVAQDFFKAKKHLTLCLLLVNVIISYLFAPTVVCYSNDNDRLCTLCMCCVAGGEDPSGSALLSERGRNEKNSKEETGHE